MKKKYENSLYLIIAIVVALLLSFSVLSLLTEAILGSDSWFNHEFAKYSDTSSKPGNIVEVVSRDPENSTRCWISVQQAVEITDELIDFCYSRTDSLDEAKARIYSAKYPDGQTEIFFNQRELHHLEDCRVYFTGSHKAALVELAIALALLLFMRIKKNTQAFARVFRKVSICFAAMLDAAFIVFGLNFDKSYDWAHGILFTNYLWILDPARDNLINLMQTEIICETAMLVLGIWNLIVLGLILARSYIRRSSKGSSQQLLA